VLTQKKQRENMMLSDVPNGASFIVKKVALGKEVGKRLADMGFTEGVEGTVVRSGLFNGPLQIRLRGYDMLIRRFEASEIEVAYSQTNANYLTISDLSVSKIKN
jgi:ferrous iron transport protein A